MKMQKVWNYSVTGILTVVMLVTMPLSSLASKVEFTDVTTDHPYYDVIHELVDAKIIDGFPDGEFKLERSLTRAQASKILSEIRNLPSVTIETPFNDIKENEWYIDEVNTLYEAGYINGYDEQTFKPNRAITRAEFSQMIVNVYEVSVEENIELPFKDVQKGSWYEPAIKTLYANGLINGINETTFAPDAEIERGDAIWLLANTDNKFGDTPQEQTIDYRLCTQVIHMVT